LIVYLLLRSIEMSMMQSFLQIRTQQLGQESQSWKEVFEVFASTGRKVESCSSDEYIC